MQPKFTLRKLGSFSLRIFAMALILTLSTQFTFAQEGKGSRPGPVKKEAAIKAKLNGTRNAVQQSPASDNDAGQPNRVAVPNTHRTEAICATFTGSLMAGDLTMPNRLTRPGAGFASTCAVPSTFPGPFAITGGVFYDTYTYTNTTGLTQCGTFTLTTTDLTNANIAHAVYNGSFDPTNLGTNYMADPGVSTGTPQTAPLVFGRTINAGQTIVIVVMSANASTAASGTASDYTLTIDFPICSSTPCSGTPAPGNTLSTANPVCPSINFTLSTQNSTPGSGVTYQWQSSPDGTAWTDIAGATNPSLVRNQTAATWYRVRVTCAGNDGFSTPLQVNLNPPSACYCLPPSSDCTDDDMITRVRISTLDNASACSAGPPAGYGNYLSLPATTVYRGAANRITVDVPIVWPESVGVWIDYNQNGTFDASEFTLVGDNTASGTITNMINIPASALTGNTRMRVRTRFLTVLGGGEACVGLGFGETEDYTVNIQPCVPVTVTTSPANTSISCSGNATFSVVTAGSLPTYGWEYRVNASSPWQLVTNGGIYSGATTSTLTLTNVPGTMNGYQYRALVSGGCSAIDFSGTATLTVTPIVAAVSPASATICTGSSQMLTLTNAASPATSTFTSGAINIPIPDANLTGANNTIAVSGIPAGSIVTNVSVTLNITHAWVSDLEVVVRGPNGQILNLSDLVSATNQSGANFTNTVFSSTGTAVLSSGARPGYTGTFKADAIPGPTGGFGVPAGPTGFLPTTTSWSTLSSTLNGNWTIAMYDAGAPDAGVLNNWSVSITYGAPATGVWTASPAAPNTMFTDAGLTTPYVAGSQATTIYVNPTVNTNYSVVYSTATPCTSNPTVIPVTVVNPVTNVVNPQNTAACVGGTATFTASGSGGPISYQWQVSTDGGTTWTNVASGGTGATLNVTGVTMAMNNYRYRAVLAAAPCAGSVNTTGAILTVNALPQVTLSSTNVSLLPNQTTTLTATSTPAAAANGWSWTYNHSPIPGTSNTQTVNIDQLGVYQASVVDVNGCVSTSNELEIKAEAGDKLWIYPNPTTGQFQVRLFYGSNVAERRIVTIYNQLGQVMMSRHYNLVEGAPYLQMDFDLGHLPRGIYAVKVAHQFTGKVVSGLVILE